MKESGFTDVKPDVECLACLDGVDLGGRSSARFVRPILNYKSLINEAVKQNMNHIKYADICTCVSESGKVVLYTQYNKWPLVNILMDTFLN